MSVKRILWANGNSYLSDEDLMQQVGEYIANLGKVDFEPSLEYENELCPCCGELTGTPLKDVIRSHRS